MPPWTRVTGNRNGTWFSEQEYDGGGGFNHFGHFIMFVFLQNNYFMSVPFKVEYLYKVECILALHWHVYWIRRYLSEVFDLNSPPKQKLQSITVP